MPTINPENPDIAGHGGLRLRVTISPVTVVRDTRPMKMPRPLYYEKQADHKFF
jgi:hypothetical protein